MITAHFSWVEAVCRHCQKIPDVAAVVRTSEFMERLREELGIGPLHVNSWCRCRVHNAAIGGEENSLHIDGLAVDFTARYLSPRKVQARCKELQKRNLIGGLGRYASFTHVDRGERRNWSG